MKPAPRLTIQPMTPTRPLPPPLVDLAHTLASAGSIILAIGGATLILIAIGGTPT